MIAKINVNASIREYPDNDGPHRTMVIRNHWNLGHRVVIELDGKEYIFCADDIINAIHSAQNAHKGCL